jgi:hypothetical protein
MTMTTRYGRSELQRLADEYLDAMARRDPARLSLASTFRLTENGQELALGDGLWATASGRGRYRHYVLDPASGHAAFVGVLAENGKPVILAARLRFTDGRLAEAEMIVSREDVLSYRGGAQALDAMGAPAPVWTEAIGASARSTREDLVAVANAYFTALERNDGTRTAPFEPHCRRLDNGVYATQNPQLDPPGSAAFYALGPAEQLRLGYFVFVTEIRERRCPVVDEECGVVFSLPLLDHAGTIHEAHLTDGRAVPIGVVQPFSWQIAELFKVRGGRIAQIEVVLNKVPYRMPSNWA